MRRPPTGRTGGTPLMATVTPSVPVRVDYGSAERHDEEAEA
ncbi:hypothetical protein ABT001_05220 [Streptomyces sp. NPDC002793]